MKSPHTTVRKIASTGFWIGVVGSKESLGRIVNDTITWWCLPAVAQPDDHLILYCARGTCAARAGAFGIFQITKMEPDDKAACSKYGSGSPFTSLVTPLVRVEVRRIKLFDTPLKLEDMRRDPVLGGAQFVRRNCQGTYFPLKRHEFLDIECKLESCQSKTSDNGK